MARLSDIAEALRSKNAGPFWVTIDIFLASTKTFDQVAEKIDSSDVAGRLKIDPAELKRFELRDIRVVKFSFPRPQVQGTHHDRDMHGAQFAWLLSDIEI